MGERITNVKLGASVGGYVKDVTSAGKATDDLRTKAERFSRGKYDAKLGLNTAKARTDLSALERQLQAFGKSTTEKRVNLNTLEAEARALALQERLEALGTKVTDAQVDVDDSKAQAKLSQMEAALLAIGERSASADLDLKGVATAEAQLGVLEAQLADFDRKRYEAHVGVSGAEGATKQTSFLVDSLLMLGPAAVPIGTALVPAVAALSSGLAAAAVGGGALMLAFKGIGSALTAVNNYALNPTDAHLQAMQQALQGMGPAGRDFVMFLQSLRPKLQQVQELARAGVFPGLEAGISSALGVLPQVDRLISRVSAALGNMAASAGAALDSPYWKNFIGWLSNEAPAVLAGVSRALGNLAHGFAGVMVALDPMAQSFGASLGRMAQEFAQWGAGLATSQGFHDFVSYIEETGPRVADLLGSLAQAIVAIAEAAAPVGAATLPLLTALAKTLTVIADSPAGPALVATAAGLAAVNRVLRTMEAVKASNVVESLSKNLGELTSRQLLTRGAAGIAGVGLAMSGLGDSATGTGKAMTVLKDTASGALIGFATGNPIGAAIGAGTGLLVGLGTAFLGSSHSADQASAANQAYVSTLNQVNGALTKTTREMIAQSLQQAGVLKTVAGLGLDPAVAIRAAQGESSAINMITAAIHQHKSALDSQIVSASKNVKVTGNAINGYHAEGASLQPLIQKKADLDAASKKLLSTLGVETAKVKGSQTAWQLEHDALDGVQGAMGRTDASVRALTQDTRGLMAAQKAYAEQALASKNATVAYKQAVADARQAAANNTHTLNLNTQAGRDNMTALTHQADMWNALPPKLQNAKGAYESARKSLIATAEQMGATKKRAEEMAAKFLDVPEKVASKAVLDDAAAIADIAAYKKWLESIDGKTATSIVRTIHEQEYVLHNKATVPTGVGADGTTVPKDGGPYADRYLYMLAPGEEVISNRHGEADRFRAMRAAGMIPGLADGGTAGVHYTVADRLNMLNLEQQIHQLIHQLNATGKNALSGLAKQIAQVQLQQTRIQLRQAQRQPLTDQLSALRGIGGLDVSSALGTSPRDPVTAGVRDQFASFRQQIKQAGGDWTKAMQRAEQSALKHARAIDADNRAITRQQHHLDALSSHLGDLNSQMDSLKSTMASYSQSVGGNFLTNPFGQGGQTTTFQPTVQNSPALSAATDQLNAAKAHLASLQGGGDLMTRLANAAEASRVEQTIAPLQAQVDALSQPVTKTTDALSAFKDTLADDTKRAQEMNDALKTLASEGLNTGMFGQLAASGDVGFAQELAAAGQSAVDDINTLWNARATAAAQVAALATQTVYGQQQAILQGQIQQQNRLIQATNATMTGLRSEVKAATAAAQRNADREVAALRGEMADLRATVAAIPRAQQDIKRGGKGRG